MKPSRAQRTLCSLWLSFNNTDYKNGDEKYEKLYYLQKGKREYAIYSIR